MLPPLRVGGSAPCVFCSFVPAVFSGDVLSHLFTADHHVATLHTRVAPFGVLPQDAAAAGP